MFRTIRAGTTPAVVIDGGDFVPERTDSLRTARADIVLQAMALMDYDAVAVGEEELILGLDFLAEASRRVPLVCGNLRLAGDLESRIPPVRWIDCDGHRVAVTAWVDPLLYYDWDGAFGRSPDSLTVMDPAESLGPLILQLRSQADLVVVVAHADQDAIADWLDKVPPVDVVIQGHEPPVPHGPLAFHNTLLVRAGPRSRNVAQLDLAVSAPHRLDPVLFKLWELEKESRYDSRIEELVKPFLEEHHLKR